MPEQILERESEQVSQRLVGRSIVDAFYANSPDESSCFLHIVLDNGYVLIPLRDDEGNGPGALHMYNTRAAEPVILLPIVRG